MANRSASLPRRDFLAGLAAAGTAVVASCRKDTPADTPVSPEPLATGDSEWDRVRAQFLLSRDWAHLGGFLLASHPKPVRDAIEAHRRGLDENPVHYLHETDRDERVRQAAAKYMGAKPEEIALTDSTTMGLAVLYGALPLRQGDEIVTTLHDHYATHTSLRLAAERAGATVRKAALYQRIEAVSEQEIVDSVVKAVSPKTRVVAVTWVHSSTGLKIPVRAIADALAKQNAGRAEGDRILFCVDGVHGFGAEDAPAASLGCDFFVAGCHKWIFGPRGTGVLWGRAPLWASMRPLIPPFERASSMAWMKGEPSPPGSGLTLTPGGFHSFEHRWALAEAFAFHEAIGPAKITARIHELNRHCKEELKKMAHVKLYTPVSDALSAGIVCFDVAGMEPEKVVRRLHEKRVIGTTTPYLPSYARLSAGITNSHEDIEQAVREVRALA